MQRNGKVEIVDLLIVIALGMTVIALVLQRYYGRLPLFTLFPLPAALVAASVAARPKKRG